MAGILIVDVWTVALYACVNLLSLFAMLLIKYVLLELSFFGLSSILWRVSVSDLELTR